MKRTLTAALLFAAFARLAFGAFDTYLVFQNASGKTMRVQLQAVTNSAVKQREFAMGRMAPGHRKWMPFQIVRKVDSASPNLYAALTHGAKNIEIDSFSINPRGVRTLRYKIQLGGVKFGKANRSNSELESFSLSFQKITWTNVASGTAQQDNWLGQT
ncbi:MAG: type VI secretion system tube protein Hcp [Fimbriimonadaceae bacterium]